MQSDKNRNEHNNVIQTEKVVFEVLYLYLNLKFDKIKFSDLS